MHIEACEHYMKEAIREAQLALSENEIPVGAVVVQKQKIIASAHNTAEHSKLSHKHAELIALEKAALATGTDILSDCILYTTLEPCGMCSGAIAHYRVGSVVFGAYDTKFGCMFSKLNLPKIMGQNIKCVGGVCEEECKALLDAFFARLRNKQPVQ